MSQRRFERDARRREQAAARRAILRRRRAGLAVGAVGAAVLLTPAAANAASFEVNTLADSDGSGECTTTCTLRDAITLANANSDPDTITFAQGVNGTIDLANANGQLTISSAVTITGPGSDNLAISGLSDSRIFNISGSGDARISGLTLTDGNGTGAGSDTGLGGAILTSGKLALIDSVVTGNRATAPLPQNGSNPRNGIGGGIAVTGGQVTVTSSKVSSNIAKGPASAGGGIANTSGSLTVQDSSVTENQAVGDSPGRQTDYSAYGGGIDAIGPTTIGGSHVDHNSANGDFSSGGGISTSASTYYKYSPPAALQRTAAAQPAALQRAAAGPDQLRITDSTVSGNDAQYGGGVAADFSTSKYVSSADGVTITRSTIDSNTASAAGGGASVAHQADGNDFSVRESTVSNNKVAGSDSHTALSGTGGGLDFSTIKGAALVSNSTVSGNSAAEGGGIHGGDDQSGPSNSPTGSFVVSNTTVAANEASDTGGGVALDSNVTDGANTKLTSTIVGDNKAGGSDNDLNTSSSTEGFDLAYSLIGKPPTGTAKVTETPGKPNITGQDPALGGLTDNGGPTKTLLPGATSPAIDAGNAESLTGDQRGLSRTVDRSPANVADGTDIGAVELPAQTPASTPPASNAPPPARPLTPSSLPTTCGRRIISLVDARVRGGKVVLSGLVGSQLYGKKVTIQTDPKGAHASGFRKSTTVTSSKRTGEFTARVPKPRSGDYITVRYRAISGGATSRGLKLPQSLSSKSVKSDKGTITVKGQVKTSLLGKRNKVLIRRLACGRYRTVGSARPDAKGRYKITFKSTDLRGVSLFRAEASVLVRPTSKHYVTQYARAISIRVTKQTG